MMDTDHTALTPAELKSMSRDDLEVLFETLYLNGSDKPDLQTLKGLIHELQVHQIELEMQNRQLLEAQQQLEEARDNYADLYDFAPVCYITFNSKGCIREINLTGVRMLNRERSHLLGKPFAQWLSKHDINKFFQHLQETAQTNTTCTVELQLNSGNGFSLDIRIESVTASAVDDGQPSYRSIIIDISEQRQAEREILHQAQQLSLITDAIPAMIAYVDGQERYQFVNKAYEEWFELPRDRIVGQVVRDVAGEHAYEMCEPFIRYALAGLPATFELTIDHPSHGQRDISASYIPELSVTGSAMGYFVLMKDVTDRKRQQAEQQMRMLETAHAVRVNSMGEMAAEIAHELNQPLAAISIYSDSIDRMMQKGPADQQEILTALSEIKLQADRASQVIKRLRAFVSKKEIHFTTETVNTLIQEVLKLLEVEARWNGIKIELALDPGNPTIYVDRVLIEQVIFNLARNAMEAMSTLEPAKPRQLIIRSKAVKGNEVEIDIEDSGPGLNIVDMDWVFEAFHSTKPEGMGMGLTICRSIIKSHHGRLWAISNEECGMTFSFTLPIEMQTDAEYGADK